MMAETEDEIEKNDENTDEVAEETSEDNSLVPPIPKSGFAVFNDQYYIDLTNVLDTYSTDEVLAYSAGLAQAKPEGFYALICHPKLTPRTNITKQYKQLASLTLPKLVEHGRCIMPGGKAAYCYIYEDKNYRRLYKTDTNIALGWKTDRLIEQLLIPIVMTLKDLQQRDVTHGNIRLTNLYKPAGNDDKIYLGECLSVPASYNQPTLYEPVERAMAQPIGRGEGTIKDDLYALGVVLAIHARNFDPMKGKTNDEIIAAKVVSGTYSCVIGTSDRISSGITDLLRGLMTDNDKNRWSMEDVMDWLDGRRQNVKQQIKVKKAARGLHFDGSTFFYARTLAHRMMKKQTEAAQMVEGNELMHWAERSVEDKELVNRLEMVFRAGNDYSSKGIAYWDRMLPLIAIALDPKGPIRYRTYSMHMNAIGNTMAAALVEQKDLDTFLDFFNSGIIYFWITILADMSVDVAEHTHKFEKIKGYLRQNDIISGVERCFYFLNPSIHCLSPLVAEYFATTPVEYLQSVEQVAKGLNGKYPNRIIDKHAACFLVSRDTGLVDSQAYDLSSDLDYRYALANLNILASIQKFNKVEPLPYTTEWLCHMIKPSLERYHDAEYREKLERDIETKKNNGDLYEILSLVDSRDKVFKDQVAFRRAINQYKELEHEKGIILKKLEKPKFFSERTGREWAATISGVIAVLIIIGFLILHYSGGGV